MSDQPDIERSSQPENEPLRPERLAPHSYESEQALLGSLLMRADWYAQVAGIISADDFFIRKHGVLFEVIGEMVKRGDAVDDLTVIAELEHRNWLAKIGGASFITKLMSNTPTQRHALTYAHIIERASVRRRLIAAASDIVTAAQAENLELPDVIKTSHNLINAATAHFGRSSLESMASITKRIYTLSENAFINGASVGIDPAFDALRRLIGRLLYTTLILIAGRPGSGKSSLCADIALAAARAGKKVAWFTMEMTNNQVGYRLMARIAGVSAIKAETGAMLADEWSRFTNATTELEGLPIWLNDASHMSARAIVGLCKTLAAQVGLDMVVIDYLGLMDDDNPKSKQKYQEIQDIAQACKADIANGLGVVCVVAAQLNRDCERRQNKRPQLSDLQQAGEAAADLVMGVYRDAMYDENTANPSTAELIVVKNRNGPIGTCELHWNGTLTRFSDFTTQSINDLPLQNGYTAHVYRGGE